MTRSNAHHLTAATLAVLLACGGAAQARSIPGYWVDSNGQVVRNSTGECWRSGSWTPELAIPECDASAKAVAPTMPKEVPPPTPTMAPAPAPMPAPVAVPAPPVQEPPPAAPAVSYRTVVTEKPIVLEGANFATGSSKLLPGAAVKLDEVVQQGKDHPEINFEVSGFTDSVGSERSNLRLSQARADAVKAYLVSAGLDAARVRATGYGEANPVADNSTPEGRAKNRRVEIRYTDKIETRIRVTQ